MMGVERIHVELFLPRDHEKNGLSDRLWSFYFISARKVCVSFALPLRTVIRPLGMGPYFLVWIRAAR